MNILDSIEKFNKNQINEKTQLSKKQNKEFIEFFENILSSLKEPKLNNILFEFYSNIYKKEISSIKELLKVIKKEEFENRVIEILNRDNNLHLFRTLYSGLSEDSKKELKMLFSNNFKKEDNVDVEAELFIKNNVILLTMEKLDKYSLFQLLKKTAFFESESLQNFVFGRNKEKLSHYQDIMKQYNIDSF